jgi:predicted ATP-grasp superfamily ATP-dependent carboligase
VQAYQAFPALKDLVEIKVEMDELQNQVNQIYSKIVSNVRYFRTKRRNR